MKRLALITGVGAFAVLAGVIGFVALGSDARVAPTIDTKPDPEPGIASEERAGFIRANEDCEPHEPSFSEAPGPAGFEAAPVLTGLESPTVLEFFDASTAFIGLRDGFVLRWDLVTGETERVIDLRAETGTTNDQGLIGLAVTPDRRHLIVHHTTENSSRLVAYPLEDDRPDIVDSFVVLTVRQPSSQHNGGSIEYDRDGSLWASFGDGGGQGDRWQNAQDPDTPLGAILRVDVSLDGGPLIEGVEGNPYLDDEDGHPWIFANGIRNPFRFSIDPETGEVWIGDVGQKCMEEISVIDPATDAGANLGWRVFEGTRPFLGELTEAHHEPVFAYWRDGGYCVVIGGQVYRGNQVPELTGAYVFSDYCKGEVLVFDRESGSAWPSGVGVGTPVDIEPAPDGELYVVSMDGEIFRLES